MIADRRTGRFVPWALILAGVWRLAFYRDAPFEGRELQQLLSSQLDNENAEIVQQNQIKTQSQKSSRWERGQSSQTQRVQGGTPSTHLSPDQAHTVVQEGFPKRSRVADFPTWAVEREINKHDRLIVQGTVWMADLTPEYLKKRWTPTGQEQPKVCLNIYLCNRRIPYINALLMSLMTGTNEPSSLLEYAKVNLLNTERRSQRMNFELYRDKLSKLPFAHHYNFSAMDEKERRANTKQPERKPPDFRLQFLLDEIRGLKICVESGLPWCLMVEEDAIFAVNFVDHLEQFVIGPMENKTDEISQISLYSYYNLVSSKSKNAPLLSSQLYSSKRYEKERSKSNAERRHLGMDRYNATFKVVQKQYSYGTVAFLVPQQVLKTLIAYLESFRDDPRYDADVLMNRATLFPRVSGRPRRQVEPSLVNHIGYYSERMKDRKDRGMYSQLNTDVRFTFDAGR